MPDSKPLPIQWYDVGQVKPRELMLNPRCPDCKTGPMFHPAHKWARAG